MSNNNILFRIKCGDHQSKPGITYTSDMIRLQDRTFEVDSLSLRVGKYIAIQGWGWHPEWVVPLTKEAYSLYVESCKSCGVKPESYSFGNNQLDLFQ